MPLLRYALLLAVLPVHAQVGPETVVRVQLLGRTALERVEVQAVEVPMAVVVDGQHRATLRVGETATLSARGGAIRVDARDVSAAGASVLLDGSAFALRAGSVRRTYSGDLAAGLEAGRLGIVNHVPMEPYVASVVASELGFDVPEANKAQAVLVRTYAARRLGRAGAHDVDDHDGSQVYRGREAVTGVSRNAARSTAGQVLTYRGDLADAYYYSSSGGHTASNEMVWDGAPVPYLRAVPDPYDRGAPDHRWETSADRRAVLDALSDRFGGRVHAIEVVSRSPSGRIHRARLAGAARPEVTGNQLRSAINARLGPRTVLSSKVDIAVRGDRYVFTGAGFGHGVGMSQYGAIGQARVGRAYPQILAYYFPGTEVSGTPPSGAPVLVAEGRPGTAGTPSPRVRRFPPPRSAERGGAWTARRPVPRTPTRAAPAGAPARPDAPPRRRTAW